MERWFWDILYVYVYMFIFLQTLANEFKCYTYVYDMIIVYKASWYRKFLY